VSIVCLCIHCIHIPVVHLHSPSKIAHTRRTSYIEMLSPPAIRHAEKRRTSTCPFADRIASLSIEQYHKVVPTELRPSHTCLATIVAYCASNSTLRVLGLGVGTKFLSEEFLSDESLSGQHNHGEVYGERIRDSHGEVLARRAFRRFLTEEMISVQQSRTKSAILEYSDHERKKFKLVDDVSLHFYCSSCPCGNATLKKFCALHKENFRDIPTWPLEKHEGGKSQHSVHLGQCALLVKKDASCVQRATYEHARYDDSSTASLPMPKKLRILTTALLPLHIKLSKKQSTWPLYTSSDWCPPGTAPPFAGQGSIHTCSDKLCRWNCLGLQGSLLASQLVKPIFMSSLTVGRKFSKATSQRAVCCRIAKDGDCILLHNKDPGQDDINLLSISVNHPAVMGTGVYMNNGAVETVGQGQDVRFLSPLCFAWWQGRESAEIIHGTTGYLVEESTARDLMASRAEEVPSATMTAEDKEISARHQTSMINTTSLTKLFLELHDLNDTLYKDKLEVPMTLQQLKQIKRQVSPEHERIKLRLLRDHPVMSHWNRR
jgi:hypothetical protein